MTDILDRLELEQTRSGMWADTCILLEEAAQEIRKLVAENRADKIKLAEQWDRAERADRELAAAVAAEREECAIIASSFMVSSDSKFDGVMMKHRKGQKNLELAASGAIGMSHAARKIAADIRARSNAND